MNKCENTNNYEANFFYMRIEIMAKFFLSNKNANN